ncbi:ankyrin repeat protein [Mucilaginibacter gracilis]|uniref:Ankyrin repeat protein n=1 Tax=Mucilaginibacter gracilis TaxID=423350 RepID=A0A495JAY1_9SPHI|nr:ankyrin repeat domain-containing protein [Mucilaginibacter gracilis]RKR85219.1 ankyrin repeat protein [Mucilaginibacter gracilis]
MKADTLEEYIQTDNLAELGALLKREPALANSNTSLGVSAIMLAQYYKKPAVVSLLLNYVDELTMFEAAAIGKLDVVENLTAAHPQLVNDFSKDGFTPLGLACYFGQANIADFLIANGANVNIASNNGFNVYPIHSAVAANQTQIVYNLLKHGAEVNVKQQSGVTPLHSAAQNGNLEILIMLLEHNASTEVRMEGGRLPADLAREKGFDDIAEILSN